MVTKLDGLKGKLKLYSYSYFHEYGFIGIYAVIGGKRVACITQDIYSAIGAFDDTKACKNKINEAEKIILNKILDLYEAVRNNS